MTGVLLEERPSAAPPERSALRPIWTGFRPATRPAAEASANWDRDGGWDDGSTPGLDVRLLAVSSLSPRDREEMAALAAAGDAPVPGAPVPGAPVPGAPVVDATRSVTWMVLIRAGGLLVSQAGIQHRVLRVGERDLAVGGIGSVATLPQWREQGYARAAVRKATAFAEHWLSAPFALAICPREAAEFGRALGWRLVHAPLTGIGPASSEGPGGRLALPWQVAMVLPLGAEAWPPGPIDLRGQPW